VALLVGSRLGPYEILTPLGAGGMGEVYRARDPRLQRDVAIKVLPASFSQDPERLRRFEQEARAAGALNHPNITAIYDLGTYEGAPYAVQELLEGESLRDLLAASKPNLRRGIDIGIQIAEGLAAAHEKGIVHRDVKPDNLFVTKDGRVKILDFGLAKLDRPERGDAEETSMPTQTGTQPEVVLGTIGYMSPEQATGRVLDFRTDQFSFGAVLYELLTGRRAFRKETPMETLAAILREEPEPAVSLNPELPAPLCWIVERCLAKDPKERYASTHDLARDLAAVRERVLEALPQTAALRPSNLPVQRTAFVGREVARAAVRDLLLRPEVHLVTLTGPGGIGKTRLALRVAEDLAEQFPGGTSFVALAPLNEPNAIVLAISQALGVRNTLNQPPLDALRDHLQSSIRRPALLLLDNFEHLIPGASVVADLVSAGTPLKILVTSRAPLHVYGEHEFPVPALELPDSRATTDTQAIAHSEAVDLFAQRALAVRPDFAVTAENALAIAEICRRLDGLPLAIELAAARVKLLTPSAIRIRLEKGLQLLTGGARDLPARQQTLRGAIDWSHDLLSADEQRLFRRLSVFVGGCTLEAVEAVCNARSDLEVDVLEGMESMVDKSLAGQVATGDAEPRFEMLQTIREYALERLAGSGDEPTARRAHAAYCLVLAEEGNARGGGGAESVWLERCAIEHDNFRSALDWLTRTDNAEWGLRLGAALFPFWEHREHLAEGRESLMKLLRLPGAAPRTKARARALFAAGALASEQGDHDAARALQGESVAISREQNDAWSTAVSLNALAVSALDRGNVAEARALFEENVAIWRVLGERAAVGRSLSNLANLVKAQKDYDAARALYEESLQIFRELDDRPGMAWALDHQADLAREQGDAAGALSLYRESLAAFRQLGDRFGIAGSMADLGNLAREQGDYTTARSLYRESLQIFQELEHRRGIARLLECFAGAAAAERHPERALRLAGAAAAIRRTLGAPLPRSERSKVETSLEPARQELSGAVSAAAWIEGWEMPIDRAIASALGSETG
jgi:predicted ATPase